MFSNSRKLTAASPGSGYASINIGIKGYKTLLRNPGISKKLLKALTASFKKKLNFFTEKFILS